MKRHDSEQPPELSSDASQMPESHRPTEPGWRPASPGRENDGVTSSAVSRRAAELFDGSLPRRIGPYEVVEELGRGGMGQVFLARQKEPVERQVAVKVLAHASSPSSASVARFEAEQQSLALAAHPNVAQIFDAGVTEDGLPFLVMEYVRGEDICSYTRAQQLDVRSRLRLFLPVCEAVQHAHRRGVIHRDLKPGNILVLETGGKAIPKVIDFGLAKLIHEGRDLTRADAMLGTPGYMSPEQICGDSTSIDTRSDVFSLGAVLYELLTEHTPFDISRDNIARLFETVTSRAPERPSRRVPREQASLLADDLDWVVLKAMAREPSERYSSVEALAADLRAVLDARTVTARKPTFSYRLRKWGIRHRPAVIMGALALSVALVALSWGFYSRWQNAQQTRLVQRLGEEVARFDSVLRFAHTIPLHDLRPTKAEIRRRVESLGEELDAAEGPSVGPLSYAVGRGLLALEQAAEAREILGRAWQSGYDTPETALALGQAMSVLYERERESAVAIRNKNQRQARLAWLDTEFRQPIVDWLDKGRRASPGSAELASAKLAFYEQRYDDVLAAVERALAAQPWLYEALILRAEVYRGRFIEARDRGDFEAALAAITDARSSYDEAARLGESDPEALVGRCRLAVDTVTADTFGSVPVENLEGLVEEGLAACQDAIEADSERSSTWALFAELQRHWGINIVRKRPEIDPIPVLAGAVAAAGNALELDESDAEAWMQLGRTHRELYRIDAAGEDSFDHLAAAVDALEKSFELDPNRASVATGVATVYSDMARRAEAEGLDAGPFYDRAEAGFERALELVPDHVMYYNLGILMRLRSRWEIETGGDPMPFLNRAAEHYRESIALNDNYPWADNNLGFVHMQRAEWWLETGGDPSEDLDLAEASMRRAETLRDGLIDSSGNLAIITGIRGRWAWTRGEDPEPFWHQALEKFANTRLELISDDLSIDPRWAAMTADVLSSWADYQLESGGEVRTKIQLLHRSAETASSNGKEEEAVFIEIRAKVFEARRFIQAGDLDSARAAISRASTRLVRLLELLPSEPAAELLAARVWLWRARLAEQDASKLESAKRGLELLQPRPKLAEQAEIEGSLELEKACAGERSALARAQDHLLRAVEINPHLQSRVAPLLVRAQSATGC